MDQSILDGRNLIETYRVEHTKLYNGSVHIKDIPDAHTPLLSILKEELGKLGYSTIGSLFEASKIADDTEITSLEGEAQSSYERWE